MHRTDGYRVRTDDPMYEIAAYVMDKRYDASNFIKQDIDLEVLQDYIKKMPQKGNLDEPYGYHNRRIYKACLTESVPQPVCYEQEDIRAQSFLCFFCDSYSGQAEQHGKQSVF